MPAARPTQWSKRLQPHNKYRHFIVGGWINAGRGQERRFSKEVQPQSLHGLRVTGKIIINNTENLLGAYYDLNVTRSCAMKHSTKQSSHPISPCLPLASSNRTIHSIKHIYWMYTTHDPTTRRSLYSHIQLSPQRYRQQSSCSRLKAIKNSSV